MSAGEVSLVGLGPRIIGCFGCWNPISVCWQANNLPLGDMFQTMLYTTCGDFGSLLFSDKQT